MSIKESALNTITALTNSDFIRMVTSAGASRKATLQSIAQHILETYTGTSLAGSNQSVKAAIDGLNSTVANTIQRPLIYDEYINREGVITTYSGWARTPYIPVTGGASITVFGQPRGSSYNCFFNSSKEFLSYFSIGDNKYSVDVPNDAAFAILSNTAESMVVTRITFN